MQPFNKKHLFIGGSVGVGKSSLLDQLFGMLENDHVYLVREYIDYDPSGEMMLSNQMKGKFSDLFFQRYVLEMFRSQVETEKYREASIILWERHPMECFFFMKKSVRGGRCPHSDFDTFQKEMIDFCLSHDIPLLDKENFKTVCYDSYTLDVPILAGILQHILFDSFTFHWGGDVYCFLFCSDAKEQLNRIKRRGRKCEIDYYKTRQQLLDLNKEYLEFIREKNTSIKTWEKENKIILN